MRTTHGGQSVGSFVVHVVVASFAFGSSSKREAVGHAQQRCLGTVTVGVHSDVLNAKKIGTNAMRRAAIHRQPARIDGSGADDVIAADDVKHAKVLLSALAYVQVVVRRLEKRNPSNEGRKQDTAEQGVGCTLHIIDLA